MEKIVRIAVDFGNTNSAVGAMEYLVDENGNRTPNLSSIQLCSPYPPKYAMPTVIVYKKDNPDNDNVTGDLFGRDAMAALERGQLYSRANFKKALFDESAPEFAAARECTLDYFRFLKDFAFPPFDNSAKYETSISMPVRRTPADAALIKELAAEAGFRGDVSIVDEAECAFRYALSNEQSALRLMLEDMPAGRPANVLLVDIGGSTADIMLFKIGVDGDGAVNYENLSTWPPVGEQNTLGGYRVDELLRQYLSKNGFLNRELLAGNTEKTGLLRFQEFKEDINGRLKNGKTVKSLGVLTELAYMKKLAPDADYEESESMWITPERYTKAICASYIDDLIRAIRSAISGTKAKNEFTERDIDAVVVGGGGSKLYFLRDVLLGRISGKERPLEFTKVQSRHERCVTTEMPENVYKNAEFLYDPSMMCVLGNLYDSPKLSFRNSSNADYWLDIRIYQYEPGCFTQFKQACETMECDALCGEAVVYRTMRVAECRDALPQENNFVESVSILRDHESSLYYVIDFLRVGPDGQRVRFNHYCNWSVRTV